MKSKPKREEEKTAEGKKRADTDESRREKISLADLRGGDEKSNGSKRVGAGGDFSISEKTNSI